MDSVAQQHQLAQNEDKFINKKKGKALIAHDFQQKGLIPIMILSLVILASI
jgi:hypothetical protein